MRIDILTLFPAMFSPLSESIIKKAREKGFLDINIHNIRDYSKNKHKSIDDVPYGGGAGMVIMAQPVHDAISSLKNKKNKVISMTPTGKPLDQETLKRLAKEKNLIILCGHYEGIDDRVCKDLVDEEISIGDYILTGGELPAMVLIDAVSRFTPGVLGNENSSNSDSFYDGLLEGPHYTRPEEFSSVKVPKILLSGNHKEINKWRRKRSLETTLINRPDLFAKVDIADGDRELMNEIVKGNK